MSTKTEKTTDAQAQTVNLTTNDLAERLRMERADAYGLIKFLEAKGMAKVVGIRPNPNGKGKGSNVYALPVQIHIDLSV